MYAKVFSQMYDGSLCTHGPWEALVTFQQLLVLADQEGNVDMTAEAIARRTTIPLNIIKLGIEELLKPDSKSRTPVEEGRRIIPLSSDRDWGWLVVNYKHYRQLKREEDRRDYHREYWHKRKTQQTQQTQPNQPIAEAKTEAKVEVKADKDISTAAQSHPAKPRKRGSAGGVGFDLLWAQYPKKQAKAAAIKAFDKLAPSAELLDDLLQAVAKQRTWPQWTREGGQFVPMLATWINNRRWEDELARHGHETSETPRQRAARARVAEMTGGLMGSEPYQSRGNDYDEVGRSPVHAPIDALR